MKSILFLIAVAFVLTGHAQPSVSEEFLSDPNLSASNSVAYPGPIQKKLTPAPLGKKPFYLSHYGRHGSRYLTKTKDYEYLAEVFQKASEQGKLTALGSDVYRRISILDHDAHERWGDLTPLGIQQLKDIAHRMVKNFPEIFKSGTNVDARSTLVPRCVLSMTSALLQLNTDRPKLNITISASPHDMYFMNLQDKHLINAVRSEQVINAYEDYKHKHCSMDRLLGTLFNDAQYIKDSIDSSQMAYYLFRLAGSVQNTERRNEISLYDIYTPEEIVENWRIDNVWWYLGFGHTPLNGGTQPYSQRNLLRTIITQADSCIALDKPNVHLRFGHDTMVLPLVCLMGINGYDHPVESVDSLEAKGWINYRVFPMACNLQFVFYRKNAKDKDVLVKVLLNENEAILPVKTDLAPYYHWNDVRNFYLKMLDAYQEVK
jgi:hypothetical protein